jgi:hypothetical protein
MLFFFVGNGGMKASRYWQQRNEYSMLLESAPAGISIHTALTGWGTGGFFYKISAPFSLINTCQMNLISAGSIAMDSTLKLTPSLHLEKGLKSPVLVHTFTSQ